MSDDGFEEFSDEGSDSEKRMDIGEETSTDFFGEDNRQYRETTVDSPFEIPYSNMRDLGKRKPKVVIQEDIALPATDNDVNVDDLPLGSDMGSEAHASEHSDREGEKDGGPGGMTDLMRLFQKRAKEDARSPPAELVAETQAKVGVAEAAPIIRARTVQEDYEQRIAKFKNYGPALNHAIEDDEFDHEDPLVTLGLAEKKDKKKKKERKDSKDTKEAKEPTFGGMSSHTFSVSVQKPIGLTSAVQAQAVAAQKEKDKKEILHVESC